MGQMRAHANRRERGGAGRHGDAARSDHALVEGLLAGHPGDFDLLYHRYFARVYAFVYSRVRSHADAEEIVQEVFLAVFDSIGRYHGTSSLLAWIHGIARNLLNNHLRSEKRRGRRVVLADVEQLEVETVTGRITPADEFEFEEYRQRLMSELAGVSSWQTSVFALRHLKDLSIAEISHRTQRSSDSVRSSLFRLKRVFVEQAELGAVIPGPKGVRS